MQTSDASPAEGVTARRGTPPLKAVCFDLKGVLLHHLTDEVLPGMQELVHDLSRKGVKLAVVSRFPPREARRKLGALERYFRENVLSGGGEGKLHRIEELAARNGIPDLSRVAFVDDKADNILPVVASSNVFVVGFRGSGKYPDAEEVCRKRGISYAQDVEELKSILLRKHLGDAAEPEASPE